ncbi:hypothetical protein PHYSODRAFT_528296 [Phytophthora sojae]|uniref:DnaJ homologue subfamily C GRV2/DNAJC13 N-terminal domain-containing protein n=1 Tax=Phytophthora sojae (strain P6497) TaxID=1094619 RepID=G5A9U1_PHYSP|nr:hypothetical protein PHYSODRAFT_528296 [Phytophthora sojae]EGZ07371.1 hypothetical protein PHYSODRAFT_528296 [Phytophthora sojae]|eukprot:XP_009536937.1 hypothetical protein PHYSODRAFT_528296 [Phytophthora sojae]
MALPRSDDSDAELQQLTQKLDPLVFGRDLATLDARFVPRGPETTGFEVEPRASSFYGALPAADAEDEDDDDDDFESLEVPANRYAGVIYAARFFVTRVGFLRSAKRLMVLSSNHLTIVDPYSDEVKERYAFDNIKEITIASDSGGHNADRAFTIFIGKNLKETYTCRCRQQLLSAYYQLRERASSFRKDEIDAATADALSAVGASVGTSDNSWATGSGGPGGPGGSNSNLLGSGMYFDSLFQLCGKTFTMTKLSTTRSIAIHPVKVDVLLAVRAASLDRLDPKTRTTLSSILLIDIVKIQRVNTNSNELVLYFENNRVHRYWCDSREPFIQAIANNLRSWLSVSLFVEEVSDSCEFDALTSTRDIPPPVTFEIPVLKISKNNKLQLRLLGLTALAIIERDPVTRKTMASHSLNDIFNVVIYPSISSSQDDPDSEVSEGLSGKFALELKHGLTRRYICLSSTVSRRDKDVSLGLQRASSQHENELRQIIGDIAGDINVPEWLKVAGATTLLSPKEARSLFLSNMIEMCRMNKLHVPWSTEETKIACKEGTWGTEVHPEWEDILLRKLVNLNFIPNLVTNESMSLIYHQLVQFNRNIPLGGLRQRDRRAFASLMKLLENFKDYSVAQLNSPSNTDAPIPTTEFQVELLLAIQRLLCTRGVFEEIPSSQYKNSIEVIMELLHSPMEEVSFAAACVIKYMVVNYSDTRSLKSETANRRAIFTKYHSRIYVSRAFDLSRTNRVGRMPLHSTSLLKTGSGHGTISVASMSNTERSMANALAYSQLGLDYLVLAMVLQTLEVCLSSGKKATPERVARDLLRAMRVDDFSRHHALFLFNRSLSFSITKCSSILVKVHILEQPTELVELIQDFARKHGALVWQLYLALYTQDKGQRRISSQLVALLTHENPRSSYVIRNIFPHALLDDQKASQLEYDEFGRHLPTANPELYAKGNGAAHKNGSRRDITNATESGRSKLSYGINTRARLARNVKHAVLLPEFFDRLGKTYATKDLVWGPNAVEELIRKLQAEMSELDLYRLKYLGYLYTDPLATDHTESEWEAHQASRLRQDSQHANFAPFLFEFLQNGSESRLAIEMMKGTISSSNRFARYMPLSFLLNPDTSDDVESDGGLDDDNYDSDENYTDDNGFISRSNSLIRPSDTPEPKQDDQDGTHEEFRNAPLIKKKKKSAKNMPRWFVAWNCNEFRIDYECLEKEVKVGPYYLANILDDRGVLVEDIEGAEKFMTLLYYRLLAEDRNISVKKLPSERYLSSDSLGDVDQSDIRLLVLKVMIQLYERHFNELGSLMFLNHFLRVSMMKDRNGDDRRWPLVVRGNIMLFLDRVLSSAINVSRFLREGDNVTMVLDLLREVKPLVVLQGPNDSEKEYIVEPAADVQAELDATIDALEESGAESSIISSHSVSPTYAHRDDDSVHEEEPSRVTVVAEHCGAMSGSMIMQTCLSVLSRLIDCHTAEEEGHMYQDVRFPKYGRLTHFEGSGVSPISSIKHRLCEDQTLRFLVGLLDCPNRIVFKKCLGLIRLLVRHNESIIPNLHASGIFYYLLRFAQDVDEMSIAARLISHIHLRQSGLDVPHLIDDKQKGENKKGVFSPDPLTRICLRSWLVRLLPVSMVAQLLRHGPRRFATALFSDANNPEVVWNANMRSQMVTYIEKFMELHTDENGMFYISEKEGSEHKACIALIQYPKEVHALQCYQYYLHNLLDEKNFPGWPINDEAAFLRALLDSIRRWVHPGLLLTARGASASKDQSTKLLSVFDAVELLDATALLLRRFPDSPSITNLQNFSYFLEALERCITELKDNRVGPTRTFFDVSNAIATKTTFVKAFGSAIRVINLAVGISDENAHECSSGLGLRVLCNSLQLLFHNQEALSTVDGCTPNVMTHWVLEALVNVLNQPNGRVSAAAQSIDLLPCLTRFLSQEGDRLATDLSLQIVYEMAGSSGEMAEVLLLQLAEHGILWYLTLLLFHYKPNNDDGDSNIQRISIGAAKALGRILEANAREETIAVFVKRMQTTIEQIFTRPLVDILRRAGPIKMLDVLATEVREPHVMWTERMRKELISLAQRAIQFHTTLDQSDEEVHKVFELPPYFMYTAQKEELCVAGIYVNFFNENPKNGILAQIAGTVNGGGNRDMFKPKPTTKKEIQAAAAAAAELENRTVSGHVMHGLLAALSYDISGVRAQPQALESVLLQRLLPVATAIRHLLQYTPDMDVQVVQADGLLTLLFVLDHETQPQGFSFANAPLLQLRCMECVHMLSFSGKCVDPLATVVPPFIKSAFQVVYKNLARTEASTEGQLARVTLQLLGNLCLIPACIDNLVKGMDPASLSNLLPHVWLGDSTEMQLLLCLHMIPLKRHTQAATEFAKAAVSSQLAAALLNLLSTLVPRSKMGESTTTKQYAARFLSVLSSNPGSGGAISSLLIASRVWETHGDTTQATSEDLRRLLVPPHAPALLKAPHANPNKVG